MYFSTYSTSLKTPFSSTSSYDSLTPSTTVSSNPATGCAYPSWPRRPSLSSAPFPFQRHIPTTYITDDELFFDDENDYSSTKANAVSDLRYQLPVSSPVGSMPSMERGASFSSMSQRDLVRRLRGQQLKVEAAQGALKAQRRKKAAKADKAFS